MLSVAIASVLFNPESQTIVKIHQGPGRPVAVVMHYQATSESWGFAAKYMRQFYEAGLPVYHSMASAAKAIDRYIRYSANQMARAQRIPRLFRLRGSGLLSL